MKTLNEHVWVVEVQDEEGIYWPYTSDCSRKDSREVARWLRKGEDKKVRVRKYVPESKGSQEMW